MDYRRVYNLSHTLLMSTGEKHQIVGVEGEVWGRPGEGGAEFGGLRHFVIGIDGEPICTLRGTRD